MIRRAPLLALPAVLALSLPAAPAQAAAACSVRADEVRFDDGRLVVERTARAASPRTVRERWWACWRPTGRRTLLLDRRHPEATGEVALLAVRRGRFVVLAGGARLDVHDARSGRLTAALPLGGAVRELAVSATGRAGALQEHGRGAWLLYGADGTRSCVLDAGAPTGPGGTTFGDLSVRRERLQWHRDGVTLAGDLTRLRCPEG